MQLPPTALLIEHRPGSPPVRDIPPAVARRRPAFDGPALLARLRPRRRGDLERIV